MAFPKYNDIQIPLLKVLVAAGGSTTAKDAVEKVTSHFPDLSPEDLQAFQPSGRYLKWPNMVRWARQHLVDKGAIDGSMRGVWSITDTGRAMVKVAEKGASPPTVTRSQRKRSRRKPNSPPNSLSVTRERLAEVLSLEKELHQRLRSTSQSGTDATAFEEALADAFRFLGYDAVQIGGRGDTDVLVKARLGKDTYVAVVDAKSSRSGKVPDTSLNFASLRDHKEKNHADYIMVVAPSFRRGKVVSHAEREEVVLMELQPFLNILETHQKTPLSLLTLREMFTKPGLYGTEPDRIKESSAHFEILATLLPMVINKIEHWYQLGLHAPVTADSLFIAFVEEFREARYAKESIEAALKHLASPFVGALRKNETGYYLTMPSKTVQSRLLSLSEQFSASTQPTHTSQQIPAEEQSPRDPGV